GALAEIVGPLVKPALARQGGGGPGLGGGGRLGLLEAAAGYLGLTVDQLLGDLTSGKTLAREAEAKGKTVDGLKQAVTDAIKAKLDALVAAGRLTSAQEQQMLAGLPARLDALVNGN